MSRRARCCSWAAWSTPPGRRRLGPGVPSPQEPRRGGADDGRGDQARPRRVRRRPRRPAWLHHASVAGERWSAAGQGGDGRSRGPVAVGGALFLNAGTGLLERGFIYYPSSRVHSTPGDVGLTYEDVSLVTSDGVRIEGWFMPGPRPVTWLWFPGNAGNMGARRSVPGIRISSPARRFELRHLTGLLVGQHRRVPTSTVLQPDSGSRSAKSFTLALPTPPHPPATSSAPGEALSFERAVEIDRVPRRPKFIGEV